MLSKYVKTLGIISGLLSITSCGTLFSGTEQTIRFKSNVPGVQLIINGEEACQTPCSWSVKRQSSSIFIIARKRGYEEKVTYLNSTFNRVSLFNLTSLASWTTDLVSGGFWRYTRESIYLNMEPVDMNDTQRDSFAYISKIRHFVLFNYYQLREEAFSGGGNYVDTLASLTKKDKNNLKRLIMHFETPEEFLSSLADN